MNHTELREIQASGISVPRGEVLVPTHLSVDALGLLACPAAPLVAGSLERRECKVRLAPVAHGNPLDGDAVLHLATLAQEDGSTLALAAAAPAQDKLAAAFAKSAVEEWASVADSRTVLAGGSPWCSGARNALAACRQAVATHAGPGRTVWLLGQFMLPPESADELAALGAIRTDSVAQAQPGDVVVFPAQGVPADVRLAAADRGLTVVDATCPIIAEAQDHARRTTQHGQHLVLIGQPEAAAANPIASRAAGHVTVVESAGKTATLHVSDAKHVSYMLQPGMPVEAAGSVVSALRARYPAARGPQAEAPCYAASDRAATIRAVGAGSDIVFVLGEAQSADGRQLIAMVRDAGAKVQPIASVQEITPAMLAGVTTIGAVESTSAPTALAGQVVAALEGLGRVSVARRQVSTEAAAAPAAASPR